MKIKIKNKDQASRLRSTLSGFSEQTFFRERFSLLDDKTFVQVKFAPETCLECSLCGIGIGYHEDGGLFYEPVGFLTRVKVRLKTKKDNLNISNDVQTDFSLRNVLICYTCLNWLGGLGLSERNNRSTNVQEKVGLNTR